MDQTRKILYALRPHWDDDSVDKLNYFWTSFILATFSLTIAMKQYVGNPLECWVPQEFRGYWEQYAEHFCFVENTYFVPINHTIPDTGIERVQRELGYYQWVPIVLALQAFMFILPRFIWGMLNTQGYNVPAIVQATMESKKTGSGHVLKASKVAREDIEKSSQYLSDAIKYRRAITSRKKPSFMDGSVDDVDTVYAHPRIPKGGGWISPMSGSSRLFGYYTTLAYLLIKILYVINVIGQLFMMNRFLAPEYTWWGFGILNDLVHGRQWHESGHFPRVTLCDFTVRKLGQLQTYTIQCVLVLNMLNEKIYLFLWWWFLLVSILTILNFLYWILISLSGDSRVHFVTRYLLARGYVKMPSAERQVQPFVYDYLKADGVLLLRLISANAGDVACANLICELWKQSPHSASIYASTAQTTLLSSSPETEGFIESTTSTISAK